MLAKHFFQAENMNSRGTLRFYDVFLKVPLNSKHQKTQFLRKISKFFSGIVAVPKNPKQHPPISQNRKGPL